MKRTGYRSPGRRAMAKACRKAPLVRAKNCPDIFAEDAEFMRLFRESKRLEGIKGKAGDFQQVMNKLKSRAWWLEKHATAEGRDA